MNCCMLLPYEHPAVEMLYQVTESITRSRLAQLCPVVLTDHNKEVLSVLERNAALNRDSTSHGEATAMWRCAKPTHAWLA